MKAIIIIAISFVSLYGCVGTPIEGFNKYESSGISGQAVDMVLYFSSSKDEQADGAGYLSNYIDDNPHLQNNIFKLCDMPDAKEEEKRTFLSNAVVPIVAAFGKYVFDMAISDQINDLQELKASAIKSYNSTAFLSVDSIKGLHCGVIARYEAQEESESKPDPGLIVIFRVLDAKDKLVEENEGSDLKDKAFVVEPVYVQARNSVAVTNNPGNEKDPKINVTLGVGTKIVGLDQAGNPKIAEIGQGVVSLGNVSIDPTGQITKTCSQRCGSTGLIPYPLEVNGVASLGVSIVETGHLGIKIDERVAELEALRSALGPAVKESLKDALD